MILQQLHNVGWLLHHCSKIKAYRHGQSLHACIIKTATQTDVILANHLLNMYAKCDDISAAHKVFEQMPQKNLVSWSAIISGYYQAGNHSTALKLFSLMELQPNEFVYASCISACTALSALPYGKQIHAQSLKFGFETISFVSNSLISMYMSCGLCNDAFGVFSSSAEPNSVVSYNALISGFAENKQPERGLEVFKFMLGRGVFPDQFTLVAVLGICTDAKDSGRGTQIHCIAIKVGLDSVSFVGNVILVMYSKCNSIDEMEKAFRGTEYNDVISWNTIISSFSSSGHYAKGLGYFQEMIENGIHVSPDDFTLASSLACCAGIASIYHGKQIHSHIIRTRLNMDLGVGNSLVNMYSKCGSIECAITIFHQMPHHNIVSWNTIIVALGNHGLGQRALYLFEQMKAHGVKPDSVTFIGLLSSCNHAGLVDEGESCFSAMKEIYGISPEIEHLSCLIDLLGRGGRLNKAKEYLEKFPFGKDFVVLGSLLSACRLHRNVAVGEWVAYQLMELQPVTSSPYVLMSNLYASSGMWDGVADAWKMLKGSGVKKETGYSLVEVKGVAEKFSVGDFSHSSMQDMKDILGTLHWEALTEQKPAYLLRTGQRRFPLKNINNRGVILPAYSAGGCDLDISDIPSRCLLVISLCSVRMSDEVIWDILYLKQKEESSKHISSVIYNCSLRETALMMVRDIPLMEDRAFLTLSSHPSQSILIFNSTVWNGFLRLWLWPLLTRSEKYSKVPETPILCFPLV